MTCKKALSVALVIALLMQMVVPGHAAMAAQSGGTDKQYSIWFDEEAPQSMEGFERWSLPLGNGYMGINVFGGVERELVSVTESSMFNPSTTSTNKPTTGPFGQERTENNSGGLNTLAMTYIDFGHSDVTGYKRELSLNDSVAKVSYVHEGTTYTREYFATYPDKVTVMRLSADKAGALTFILNPIAPFCYPYLEEEGDGLSKTGTVTAEGDTITLKGTMDYYNVNYEGLYKVIPVGGTMTTGTDADGNGTITVTGADSAVILLAVGTNYSYEACSFDGVENMLDESLDPHEMVQGYLDAAAAKSYDTLLAAHQQDYKALFDRVKLDLGGVFDSTLTTDQLVSNYKNGTYDPYLEEIEFIYGRYLLIASSRNGCLPANLQGIWNFSDSAAWTGGYWHNINVQMNYWMCFNTNLTDLFLSYVDYNEAMREMAQKRADQYLELIDSPLLAEKGTGENGYTIGTGCWPYYCALGAPTGHSGPGTVAFTSLLFWDYYDFTRDENFLRDHTYPAVEGAAKFLTKTLSDYNGKYLVYTSASPENKHNGTYPRTVGTAFDQQMVYGNHSATLQAAQILGYTKEDYPILETLAEQIDNLDPVNIGYSGQVKEYREENYYGEIGEKNHRHISQLVGVFPGSVINGTTDAWLEAAGVTLENRGDSRIAWGKAHRMLCWARIQDAEKSYEELQGMLKENTANNLWGIYSTQENNNPFQIESNFGYSTGVAEMLVQSHAGYIEFLPALPEAWADGSFEGLTARGNFVVDAAWENGVATSFGIESRSSSECAVKYPNIANAVVTDSKGNPVTVTKQSEDLISFETTEGEVYTISQIPSHTPNLAAPEALTLTADDDVMDLSWTANTDAVSYNVYRAVNDTPTYQLVQQGVTGTSYTYQPSDIKASDRVTMRVTAVAADGTESPGALAYALPMDPLEEVTGYLFDNNDLQLEYTAVENATQYHIYENGEYLLSSKYPVAAVKNADPAAIYGVSVEIDGRESVITTATVQAVSSWDKVNKTELFTALHMYGGQTTTDAAFTGVPVAYILAEPEAVALLTDAQAEQVTVNKVAKALTKAATRSNVFYNRPVTANLTPISGYPVELAVDGDMAGTSRYAVSTSLNPNGHRNAVITVELDGLYRLEGIFVQEFLSSKTTSRTQGSDVTIEVYYDGQWNTVLSDASLRQNRSDYTSPSGTVNASDTAFVFDRSALASQVRLTFYDENNISGAITLMELQAYGEKVDTSGVYLSESTLELDLGDTLTLTASSTDVSWSSSDTQIVTVDKKGKLTAVGSGSATITATDADGRTARCAVTVHSVNPTDCPHCDAADIQWVELTSNSQITGSTSGHFYLTKDVTLSGTTLAAASDICINLRGNTIKRNGTEAYLFSIPANSSLVIFDSVGNGTIKATSYTVQAYGTFKAYHCNIENYIEQAAEKDTTGAILMPGADSHVELTNCDVLVSDSTYVRGAAIDVRGGTITVNGGTIEGGTASGNGGAIYMSAGEMTLNNVAVTGGSATQGGAVYVNAATLNVNGGSVTSGTASVGDVIFASRASSISIEDCTVSAGTNATSDGIYLLHEDTSLSVTDSTVNKITIDTTVAPLTLSGVVDIGEIKPLRDSLAGKGRFDISGLDSDSTIGINWHIYDTRFTKANSKAATLASCFTYTGDGDYAITHNTSNELQLTVANIAVIGTDQSVTRYTNVADALADYDIDEDLCLRVLDIEELALTENAVIDVNGKNFKVTGNASVTASFIDSANDDLDGCGNVTLEGVTLGDPASVDGKYYFAVEKTGAYSFHALEMKITSVSLATNAGGMYYWATYNCDDTLAANIESYGIKYELYDAEGVNEIGDNDIVGVVTGGIENPRTEVPIMLIKNVVGSGVNGYTDAQTGKMQIKGTPYVKIGGVEYTGATVSKSLYDLCNQVDDLITAGATQYTAFLNNLLNNVWKAYDLTEWTFDNVTVTRAA